MSVVRARSACAACGVRPCGRIARDKEKCTARRAAGSDSSVRRKSICRPGRAAGALRAACAP